MVSLPATPTVKFPVFMMRLGSPPGALVHDWQMKSCGSIVCAIAVGGPVINSPAKTTPATNAKSVNRRLFIGLASLSQLRSVPPHESKPGFVRRKRRRSPKYKLLKAAHKLEGHFVCQ